jgi:hypothetical protein
MIADQLDLDDLALDPQADARTRTGDPFITSEGGWGADGLV